MAEQPLISDLKPGDAILERELLLFQPAQRQHVRPPCGFQRVDRFIEVAMFAPQNLQLDPQHFLGAEFHRSVHGVGWSLSRYTLASLAKSL